MIVHQRITLLQVLFGYRLSIITKIWPRVLLAVAVATALTLEQHWTGDVEFRVTLVPFSLIGVALGIFLGFRTNASYDRFWEGRRLWGRLVNVTRTFTRQLDLFTEADAEEKAAFRERTTRSLIGYVHGLRGLLRGSDVSDDVERLAGAEAAERAYRRRVPPNAILEDVSDQVRAAWRRGWIHDLHLPSLDRSLEEVMSIQGGCERIRNTPVPFSYSFLIHRITAFYCLLIPFGIVDSVGPVTPFVTLLIAYAFFGLDAIGDEVEDPFGTEPNDLPLDTLCRNIEIDLLQMLGAEDVPEALRPQEDILL